MQQRGSHYSRMKFQAILWDLDGTLISTKRLYLEAYRRALAPYIGRVMTDEEILRDRSRSEIRYLQSKAREQYEACLRDFRQHYASLHDTHFEGVYPGIPEVLEKLRQTGVKMGIVTGKTRSSYEAGLATANLGQFDVLVMDDDVTEPKPHPEGVLAALNALDLPADAAIYVGDSITDIEAAHAAGTTAAAALWSRPVADRPRFVERLPSNGRVHLLHTPGDVLDLLQPTVF
jgi:pyrophosphatase PpaX